jgi:hypothetical protein
MRGTNEEEISHGNLNKYDTLKHFHNNLAPEVYLEIGVQRGRSFKLADCSSIGIDPFPKISEKLSYNHRIYKMTSDEFFRQTFPIPEPDLIFIDGLHLFEQALWDFINCEKISTLSTVILIDDVFPAHPAQASRERKTQKWAGDVWKVYQILKEYRKDLEITELDVAPTGMIEIKNINPKNTILIDHYKEIVSTYMNKELPEWIIERDFSYA